MINDRRLKHDLLEFTVEFHYLYLSNQTSNPMKTRDLSIIFSCFLFVLSVNRIIAQAPDSLWEHHYGGLLDDQGFYAIEGENGQYIVVGKTKSNSNGGYDAYILKLDAQGTVIWEKSYGGPDEEQIVSICPALYGGYVITGYVLSDVWLLWITEDGDSLGSVTYGGPSADQGLCIIPNIDQGYTVTATYGTGFSMGDQLWLMKLDIAGDTIWTKKYGGPSQDYGEEVIQTSDGGYMIAGRTYTTAVPEACDAWAVKTDANGDTLWTRKYGGSDEDNFNCVAETDDGYIFGGITRSFGQGIYSFYAVRTNDYGDTLWTRIYGGQSVNLCFDIDKMEDGNFVLSGYTSSFGPSNDLYLVEIDQDGNMIWQHNYGHPQANEIIYGCQATSDGGFIATGRTIYYSAYKEEVIVIKLGPAGSGTGDHFTDNDGTITIFPNPVSSHGIIRFENPHPDLTTVEIINLEGIVIKTLVDKQIIAGDEKIDFNIADFNPGLYFIRIKSSGKVEVRKVVIFR